MVPSPTAIPLNFIFGRCENSPPLIVEHATGLPSAKDTSVDGKEVMDCLTDEFSVYCVLLYEQTFIIILLIPSHINGELRL
jgi:hypothetical protein